MWLLYTLGALVGLILLFVLIALLRQYVSKKKAEKKDRRDRALIQQKFKDCNLVTVRYDFSKFNELKFHDPDEWGGTMFRCAGEPTTLFSARTADYPGQKSEVVTESSSTPVPVEKPKPIKRPKPGRDWIRQYVNKVESCLTDTKEVDVSGFPELEAHLRTAIKELLEVGVSLRMIRDYMDGIVNLSHITITKRYKIVLNDYGNMEIKMGPLPKTVFFFYLRHPEGMSFTDLQDHRDEFINIYSHVSNFDNKAKIKDSIDRLINPLDNSISEKCSAVKTAFTDALDSQVAKHYYISGNQGDMKYIHLDRTLVKWEAKF